MELSCNGVIIVRCALFKMEDRHLRQRVLVLTSVRAWVHIVSTEAVWGGDSVGAASLGRVQHELHILLLYLPKDKGENHTVLKSIVPLSKLLRQSQTFVFRIIWRVVNHRRGFLVLGPD